MSSGAAVGDAGRSAAPEHSLSLAGSFIKARYRVDAISSVSREAVVYAAEDVRHGRPVALKVLREELARDAEFAAAVRDQAWTLASSAHVHRSVARVYECDATDTGGLFIALEQTAGATLRDVLDARGALEPPAALRVGGRVGEALEALHHNGIIHGQLGPDAVFLVTDDDGTEHVTLVGVELTAAFRTPIGRRLRDPSRLAYRAPEQIAGGETTEATDVYALGMLLRELMTAERPPETSGVRAATSALPPAIERIITTATDARPELRYPDISVMLNDMWGAQTALAEPESLPIPRKARTHTHRRVRARRRHVALPIAAAVVAGVVLGGIVGAIIWASSGRTAAGSRAPATAPAATVAPIERDATPVPVQPLRTESAPRPASTSALPEPPAVKAPSTVQRPEPPVVVVPPRPELGDRGATPPAVHPLPAERPHVPSSTSAAREEPSAVRPRPAPVVVAPERGTPPAVGDRAPAEPKARAEAPAGAGRAATVERPAALERPAVERPTTGSRGRDADDPGAVIEWLLNNRR